MDKRNDGELVFAAPSYVGKIAERARRVKELEQVIVKKDGALRAIVDHPGTDLPAQLPDRKEDAYDMGAADAMYLLKAIALTALSLTPASVAKEVEDARVGRAAIALRDKWRDRIKGDQPTTRKEEAMWRELVATIAQAIAEAREAPTKHA